ncbi:hypothetical protein [Polyangium sorediatum]|uniref:Uncharacterized protein n=1 Tax=Polyangium sorediatum TaxID=889274 RepID=A0ABT6NS25_9BACT|nr:hypothetical protein [Polyangium sorediatum]MDI1431142.1 hypothetical protein [Polyangium sorediatum]
MALETRYPSLAAANREWAEAEAADTTYQKLLKESRATGAVLDKEIQTFRRSLAHAVGRNDKDFQKLRSTQFFPRARGKTMEVGSKLATCTLRVEPAALWP